jgi:CheY-like chemotaxis protein
MDPTQPTTPAPATNQTSPSSVKILVVEDDTFLREVYEETLRRGGYDVTSAIDGEDALTKILQPGWSLILLDIILPKMDGIGVLRKAKQDPTYAQNHPNTPVVFLTNLDNDAEIKQALELGNGYLIKSQLTPEDLLREVKVYLSK